MARREKRRAYPWMPVGSLCLPDGGSLWFEINYGGITSHARVREEPSGDVLWRQSCRGVRWERIPPKEREEGVMSILQKLADMKASAGGRGKKAVATGSVRWPVLTEMVTVAELPSGVKRELSRISLFLDRGEVKASVTAPELKASCFVTGESLEAVLDVLEARVQEDDPDVWRAWPEGNPRWKGKGK